MRRSPWTMATLSAKTSAERPRKASGVSGVRLTSAPRPAGWLVAWVTSGPLAAGPAAPALPTILTRPRSAPPPLRRGDQVSHEHHGGDRTHPAGHGCHRGGDPLDRYRVDVTDQAALGRRIGADVDDDRAGLDEAGADHP